MLIHAKILRSARNLFSTAAKSDIQKLILAAAAFQWLKLKNRKITSAAEKSGIFFLNELFCRGGWNLFLLAADIAAALILRAAR